MELFKKKEIVEQEPDFAAPLKFIDTRTHVLEKSAHKNDLYFYNAEKKLKSHIDNTKKEIKKIKNDLLKIRSNLKIINKDFNHIKDSFKNIAKTEDIEKLAYYVKDLKPFSYITREEAYKMIENLINQESSL